MPLKKIELRIKGKLTRVSAVDVEDRSVMVQGRWMRMAAVLDENWVAGDVIKDPAAVIDVIRRSGLKADLFTFPQRLPDLEPKYKYRLDWDNAAAIPLTTYEHWWENCIPQEARKNVRRSAKRGLVVRTALLDDEFIRGITEIYNETPVRQGKPFPKYGMDFEAVKAEVSQIPDRSEFIGAYFGEELVGFVKLVYLGKVASILSFSSMNKHFDKRPTNALIAKTVEIACAKGVSHLLYGRYTYGRKASSPLTEFKRRNGFEKVMIPRYFVPLSLRGRLILALNLHRGLIGVLPGRLVDFLVAVRAWFFEKRTAAAQAEPNAEKPEREGSEAVLTQASS
jgi:hypothetical protein